MSIYQTSFNETDLINHIPTDKPQNRMIKYRDTFSFERKSFLNNGSPANNQQPLQQQQQVKSSTNPTSIPLASTRFNTSTNTKGVNQYKSFALMNLQDDTNTAYNQHFNYVGSEPHISERIHSYNGAFGPRQDEIASAYKGEVRVSPVPFSYTTSLPPINSQNNESELSSNSYIYSGLEDRPKVRSHDCRSVWIPKKYPGRNMFYSHLDSSIFPGKYDVTEKVWNSLEEVNETNRGSGKSKFEQLIANPAKTEIHSIKTPSFTKNSGFIIHSMDKSILPTVKTDHVKAAELTKRNRFIDNSLYHL